MAAFFQQQHCEAFDTSIGKGDWVTLVRHQLLLPQTEINDTSPASDQLLVAVLIGSLLRMPYPWATLDLILQELVGLQWWLFIATAHMGMSSRCMKALCSLRHLAAISFVDLMQNSMLTEDAFADIATNRSLGPMKSGVTGGSLRQFFKLARAYELMLDFEDFIGHRFDSVLKTRTDVLILPSINHDSFPELFHRVLYAVSDVVFFCNRVVAGELLDGLLDRVLSLVGTDGCLLPINYDQLLDSDLEDVDFFLLNYPCVQDAQLDFSRLLQQCARSGVGHRVPRSAIIAFKDLLHIHRQNFETLHKQVSDRSSRACPSFFATLCTGAWWRNITALQDRFSYQGIASSTIALPGTGGSVESSKTWFYLIHSLKPHVHIRKWPNGGAETAGQVYLHPHRHISYCGA